MNGNLKTLILTGLGALLLPLASPAYGAPTLAQGAASSTTTTMGAPGQPPTTTTEDVVTVPVTVDDVDKKSRKLTVRPPDGEKVTVTVPPDVQAFDRVKKGDKIEIDYYRAVAVSVMPAGTATATGLQEREATGQMANGRAGARQVSGSAEVISANTSNNTVTVKGPNGKPHTVAVQDPAMQRKIQSLKPGDVIQITYTEAVAVALRPKK